MVNFLLSMAPFGLPEWRECVHDVYGEKDMVWFVMSCAQCVFKYMDVGI